MAPRVFGALLALAMVGACAPTPLIPYGLYGPAQTLLPVGTAPVTDGRARFRQLFCERLEVDRRRDPAPDAAAGASLDCEQLLHRFPDEPLEAAAAPDGRVPEERLRIRIVPGFLGDAVSERVAPFYVSAKRMLGRGVDIDPLPVSGSGSAAYNADTIAEAIRAMDVQDDDVVILVAYSKGATDLLHFLYAYPELGAQIDAVITVVGAVNGSALADDAPELLVHTVATIGGSDLADGGGLESLKRTVQLPWLAAHPPPATPRFFSLGAFTPRENVSSVLREGYDRLAAIDPRNDSALLFYDQMVPGATLLGWANCDHWAVALPFDEGAKVTAATLVDRNAFPREALLEALLLYVREAL